ncbi:uncharacterized protein DUF1264 [Halopolyspora algeriensis]|uniref:Uncharacterized protein DUF1264 n=1 Tax=Halopolyspora algeriensis TaxID=1500506 RepID=A0A368VXN2_9ACTN|nr:OBAP family protein [Halopolyspora algeriensis]RCW46120.1 uncharacterized protein DUF1264 [Halopolyspora algeriensis]TQM55523.1 uncharacterized protein DUF1264 [Halopolyspora algeriensis]
MVNPSIPQRHSPLAPPGEPTSRWRATLDAGAKVLQETGPLHGFDVYVVGFHCAKGDPDMQMEAHHYCRVVNDEMLQCVLFDGNTTEANLIGIEYIVSEQLFATLSQEEKSLWHPHNFEVLSGQLVAPGLPEKAEKALMKLLVNSYGKTWHTWHTGRHDGEPGTALPQGEPTLMWSFNREGECDPALAADRNRLLDIDTAAKSADRQDFVPLARPQHGVDDMAADFTDTRPIPGVVDERAEERPDHG